eukprot:Filipodium_phascolosomae@DN118_c0_g1_i1.p1
MSMSQASSEMLNLTKEVYEYIPADTKAQKESEFYVSPWSQPPPSLKEDVFNTESCKPSKSFEQFAGKVYDLSKKGNVVVDHSGSIGTYLKTKKYTEYELISGCTANLEHFETPTQRLMRLQNEMTELQVFIQDQEINQRNLNEFFEVDSSVVKGELGILEKQLELLLHEKELLDATGVKSVIRPMTGQRSLFASLVKFMDILALQEEEPRKDEKRQAVGLAADNITYELYCPPAEKDDLFDVARVVTLESRLAQLEKDIGSDAVTDLPFGDLQSAVVDLAERLSVLDPQKLDQISRRMQALMGELEQMLKKRDELLNGTDLQVDSKVNEMYDLCYRWRAASSALPVVIGRLKSLKALHQRAGTFASRLSVLEKQQAEVARLVESTSQTLANVQKSMSSNAKLMKANVDVLSQRVSSLST